VLMYAVPDCKCFLFAGNLVVLVMKPSVSFLYHALDAIQEL